MRTDLFDRSEWNEVSLSTNMQRLVDADHSSDHWIHRPFEISATPLSCGSSMIIVEFDADGLLQKTALTMKLEGSILATKHVTCCRIKQEVVVLLAAKVNDAFVHHARQSLYSIESRLNATADGKVQKLLLCFLFFVFSLLFKKYWPRNKRL